MYYTPISIDHNRGNWQNGILFSIPKTLWRPPLRLSLRRKYLITSTNIYIGYDYSSMHLSMF